MTSLAAAASSIAPCVKPSPWPGHEHVHGYAVMSLPTSGGDVLALRVFPVNDFAPYTTVWHRSPAGAWSIFVDSTRPETACPRYFGAAAKDILPAAITVRWTDPSALEVEVEPAPRPGTTQVIAPGGAPTMTWRMTLAEPPLVRSMNRLGALLPASTWRSDLVLRQRQWLSRRVLGMGAIRLRCPTPSGHVGIACPQRIAFVETSQAVLDGRDLGGPARVPDTPMIGPFTLPARPTFAIGGSFFAPPPQAA